MEEKILIESTHYGLNKKVVKKNSIICAILTILASFITFFTCYSDYSNEYKYFENYDGERVEYTDDMETFPECEHSYESYSDYNYWGNYVTKTSPKDNYTYADFKEEHPTVMSYISCIGGSVFGPAFIAILIGAGFLLGILLIFGFITIFLRAAKITVTDMFVNGKIFGKRVVLPLDYITAFATGGFKSIAIKTPGGHIHFSLIRNRDEIVSVLKELLIDRQKSKKYLPESNKNTENVIEDEEK